MLVFSPFEKRKCTQVVIIDDVKVEHTEEFTLNLEIVDDLDGRVQLGTASTTVTIQNDDGELECSRALFHCCIITS